MEDDKNERNAKKIDFFMKNEIKVHVVLKNFKFWNGVIVASKGEGLWSMMEDRFGARLLFIDDVHEVDEYSEVRK
jgi:hypothetical protein|tara:strand:- start:117 stop:341 length:225 start_codon:yes stop_codon:yes gene_type:complete